MDDEKVLFNEIEALIIKVKRFRARTSIGLKERYLDVVITLLEQASAFWSHFILGN